MGRAFGGLKLFKGLRDGQESYAVLSISTCKAVTYFLLIALTLGLLESFALKSHLSTNPICRVLGAGRRGCSGSREPENSATYPVPMQATLWTSSHRGMGFQICGLLLGPLSQNFHQYLRSRQTYSSVAID
jgi:hypothetical protein